MAVPSQCNNPGLQDDHDPNDIAQKQVTENENLHAQQDKIPGPSSSSRENAAPDDITLGQEAHEPRDKMREKEIADE